MKYPPKPFPNCYWLESARILAGELPVASLPEYSSLKMKSLLDAGIRVFINLIQESGFNYESILNQVSTEEKLDIQYIRYPIKDMETPPVSLMKDILDTIDNNLRLGKPVYYHCYAGLGRTGVVSGCWLARHNQLEGDSILAKLSKIRSDQDHKTFWDSPQSKEQINMVRNWKFGQ